MLLLGEPQFQNSMRGTPGWEETPPQVSTCMCVHTDTHTHAHTFALECAYRLEVNKPRKEAGREGTGRGSQGSLKIKGALSQSPVPTAVSAQKWVSRRGQLVKDEALIADPQRGS